MKIHGIEGLTTQEIDDHLVNGAKFVMYRYTISLLVVTFRRGSDIYFIKPGENATVKGLKWTLLSTVLGWWGIPWGPIYTLQSLGTNLSGGKDITREVIGSLNTQALAS